RLGQPQPFDLLISTLPFADEVCRQAQLPRHWMRIANTLSREIDGLRQSDPAKAARRVQRYRNLYSGQNLIAVSSGVEKDLVGAMGIGPRNVRVVHNPFDLQRIRRLAQEPLAGLPSEDYVIHVGRFARQKRHDLLLDAWKRLEAPKLLVLLTEPHEELRRMIAERDLEARVRIAGFQTNPYPWIARARLLALCSDHEGMPNVLVEALACGTPVVATDCPSGPRELLGEALPEALVPMNDPAALRLAMQRMLARAPESALVEVQPFSPEVTVAALEHLSQEERG
ncbi:MAG: glycosyltransferase, partial [Magnetococcales bacterium]|nr:glycosyltransferase [Magnetococcales bacterium]